jgi:uncharacterized membrane protein
VKSGGLRILFLLLSVGTFALAMALPPFLDTFTEHYQPARDSALFKAKCMTCHTSKDGGARNAYGKHLDKAIHEAGSHELTVAALALIESKDSDGDGATNIEEIRAGFLPGDRSNRPPAEEGEPAVTSRPPTPPPAELIPKHSFHPLIVHFPIGLFIFGAFLEFFGKWRKREDVRKLAFWNLGFGALASLIAVPTGIAAWLRIGFTLEGNLLIHLILAVTSTLMMLAVAAWRRSGEHDSPAYWTTLALSTAAVAGAGHFGALLVYG